MLGLDVEILQCQYVAICLVNYIVGAMGVICQLEGQIVLEALVEEQLGLNLVVVLPRLPNP